MVGCLTFRLVDNHSIIGETALPRTLASLLTLVLRGSPTPDEKYTPVVFELLRVTANLCMDHDDNRGRLLEAGLPQAIVSLLEGYADTIPQETRGEPLDLSVPQLKVIKTSIGALLNASIGYDAVRFRLTSLEAPLTILKLASAIYPTGYWFNPTRIHSDVVSDEEWTIRSGLSSWAWLAISELKDVKDDTLPMLTADFLPFLVRPLSVFLPKESSGPPLFDPSSQIFNDLVEADLENLTEATMLIESLALDVDDIRLSLARGFQSPAEHSGVPCLSIILDFIENGTYPASWALGTIEEAERKRKEKAFNICKAALIKAVVEVAGEEKNADILWDRSDPVVPGGLFVSKMVDWLKRYVKDLETSSLGPSSQTDSIFNREDMVICASLSLGNLSRQETISTAFLSPPYSLGPTLVSHHLLSPSTDMKVKHGVLGFLKHIAQASASLPVQNALREVNVIRRIAESGVWDERKDAMVDVVQLNAIGVAKHMASADVENVYALVLPSARPPHLSTGFAQILALVKRTDSLPVRSEGSRVLVNVVRTLWSGKPPTTAFDTSLTETDMIEKQRLRNSAIRLVLTPESASVLTKLVGASGKYPLLVNEGLVALTMFCTAKEGALLVLDALTVPLSIEVPPESPIDSTSPPTTASDVSTPGVSSANTRAHLNIPHTPLDMLIFTLKNVDNPANFPVEVRSNVCSFLVQVSKHAPGDKLEHLKEAIHPVKESLLASPTTEEKLAHALRRLNEAWS
ncbi:hypothetical protein H0H93_014519 [Arthromyces matolae]|nr:hypothetical protein H0H93_014519 [Arthromyces matolae]